MEQPYNVVVDELDPAVFELDHRRFNRIESPEDFALLIVCNCEVVDQNNFKFNDVVNYEEDS